MKNFISLLALIFSNPLMAVTLPTTKAEFCARYADVSVMESFPNEATNLMAFKNKGGLFNGGVCWWHARFQRNIFYLSIFRPDLNRPSSSEVKSLIKEIRAGKSIVTIPGFSNFSEFSETYKNEIQAELNAWQLFDGVILGSWVNGLKGTTKVEANILEDKMKTLYQYVEVNKKIAYQKLQIKGITSHAWLIVAITPGTQGYEIGLIDSNRPNMSRNYSYKYGDTSFYEKSYGDFVPYLEFTREESRISSVAKVFCGIRPLETSNPSDWEKDYELDLLEAKQVKR